jgi:hypothetical protein
MIRVGAHSMVLLIETRTGLGPATQISTPKLTLKTRRRKNFCSTKGSYWMVNTTVGVTSITPTGLWNFSVILPLG